MCKYTFIRVIVRQIFILCNELPDAIITSETFITEDKFHIPISEEGFKDWMIYYYLPYLKTLDGSKVEEINKQIEQLKNE